MGIICAGKNGLRGDLKYASIHLIEFDPYTRSSNPSSKNLQANVSSINFSGRGQTGVDLRWHTRQNFRELSDAQKDEITSWQSSATGKFSVNKNSFRQTRSKRVLKVNLLRMGGRKI